MQARVSSATSAPLQRTRGSRQVSGPKTDSPRTDSRTGAECTGPSRRRGTLRWSATVTRATPRALSVSRSSSRDQGDSSGTAGGGRCLGGAPRCRTPGSPASATGGSWRTASTGRNVTAARTVVTQPPISVSVTAAYYLQSSHSNYSTSNI